MRISDWSSDVCSSDLHASGRAGRQQAGDAGAHRMAQQGEAFPAQRVGDVEHRMQRTGERVIRARRQVRAAAVRSEEHTSELQSLMRISYAVFCLHKKTPYSTNKRSNVIVRQTL